ncbi:MAG: hypothetical protein ACK5MA_07670 [Parachlamydiaceae bacterium]
MDFVDSEKLYEQSFKNKIFNSILKFLMVEKGLEGFRTFHGVFLPSTLSILGVILYLRLGLIVGEMGLITTFSIIFLASTITLITAFSISASSTNMKVGGGGAYFIISRSFGVAVGSSIGIPLYCAQSIGIAFYIMGFAETVHYVLPFINLNLIEFGTLAVLGVINLISTNLVMRTQFLIFIAVILSLISFFVGAEETAFSQTAELAPTAMKYWAAFALFFPAVTGLEAGVSMSGDLKNPQRSIPRGTIAAVVFGLLVYLSVAYVLWSRVPGSVLQQDSMIMESIAWSGPLIILGIFGATLSSALGSIMAAPRTLQALALDGIVPKFIGSEFGVNKEPRAASLITLGIVAICLYLGDLNYIAPILTMFFLISYGVLNLAAGFESLMNNPSWRPTIYVPASLSLFGAGLCIMAMLLIDSSYTISAGLAVIFIYLLMRKRLTSELDDIRQGILLLILRKSVYFLAKKAFSARSWRPNVLVFTQNLIPSSMLLDFSAGLTGRNGFLTLAHLSHEQEENFNFEKMKSMVAQKINQKNIEALIEIIQTKNLRDGFKNMIMAYGLNPVRPNTIVMQMDDTRVNDQVLVDIVTATYDAHKNLILLRDNQASDSMHPKKFSQLDIWWNDDLKEGNDLMVVLAHMYRNASFKNKMAVNLKCVVKDEMARERRQNYFHEIIQKCRLNIKPTVYVCDKSNEMNLIAEFSVESSMVFIAIRSIGDDESTDEYLSYLRKILESTRKSAMVALFLATEKIELGDIITG